VFVLGIDPGLSRCGYGCVTGGAGSWSVVAAGVVTTSPGAPVPARLAELRRELAGLLAELSPAVVAVERVLFQTNARTAMAVGQASGVALLSAAEVGCEVAEHSANEVKLALTGDGAATKAQVQEMVARLLRLPAPPRPPDVADALALALCHLGAAPLRRAAAGAAARGTAVGAGRGGPQRRRGHRRVAPVGERLP
jgi:crossover junction endodeoxyribonuclease RuvC